MDIKGHLGETSDRNEEYIRQWRKYVIKWLIIWLKCVLMFYGR